MKSTPPEQQQSAPAAPQWNEEGRPFHIDDIFIHHLARVKREIYNALFEDCEKLIHYFSHQFSNIIPKKHRTLYSYEDIYQETAIGLLKAFALFDSGREIKLSTLAATVIRNELLLLRRRLKQCVLSVPEEYVNQEGEIQSLFETIECADFANPEVIWIEKRTIEEFFECVQLLPERERKIMKLRIQGLTDTQISNQLNISRTYINRIKNGLKAHFRRAFQHSDVVPIISVAMAYAAYDNADKKRKRFDYSPYYAALKATPSYPIVLGNKEMKQVFINEGLDIFCLTPQRYTWLRAWMKKCAAAKNREKGNTHDGFTKPEK